MYNKLIFLERSARKQWRQLNQKAWFKPALFGSLAGLLVVIGGFFFYRTSGISDIFVDSTYKSDDTSNQTQTEPTPTPEPTPPIYTVALLGYGGAGHDGGALTDSIMIVRVDTGLEKIGLISVPRDSWIKLPTQGWDAPFEYWKVNAAYAIGLDDRDYPHKPAEFSGEAGGGSMARYALEQIVGFPIDYFIAVDFTGFKQAIDVLGGVRVQVDRPLIDPFYPIPGNEDELCDKSPEEVEQLTATLSGDLLLHEFSCRFETLEFPAGPQVMDGATALKFARSRHASNDGGDFNRSRRQRAVLFAVRDKMLAINFIPKLLPFMQTMSGHIRTDLSPDFIREMLERREEFIDYEIVAIPLTTDESNALAISVSANGQSIVVPKEASRSAVMANEIDWSGVHVYIENKLNAEVASASTSLQ